MEFSQDQPIFVQIAQAIRRDILSGALKAGDQVTSTTQYASRYGISPATANKAFAALLAEGVIEKRRGVGMFVAADAEQLLRERGLATYVNDTLIPAIDEGLRLGMSRIAILNLVDRRIRGN